MSYFEKFPLIVYEFNSKNTVVKDILCRNMMASEYKPLTDLYSKYNVVDGETPQLLAQRFYGSSFYHWVILLFNEIHNPYFDWPVHSSSIENICIDKYGSENINAIRHYTNSDGIIIGEIKTFSSDVVWVPPANPFGGNPVTFYEHEEIINESKRKIMMMRPELLGDFVSQFEVKING